MTAGHADGILDPNASRAYLRDWKSRVDKMAAAASDRLGDLRSHTVVIDVTGILVDVGFGERIQRVAPDAVSRAVMSALRAGGSGA